MIAEVASILGASEYFKGLSPERRNALASMCLPATAAKGEYLFFEGRKGHSIFLLASGNVQLLKTAKDGRQVVIKTVEKGEIFAEAVLFEKETYPVSAVAVRKSRLYKIPRLEFHRLLENREFRNDFIAGILGRLRYLTDRILHLAASDVEDRFFMFLEQQYGPGNEYVLTMSKKDIAGAIGATPETLSRLARRLKSEGSISWTGKTLKIRR